MLMLDLFAGLCGASAAMRARGWDVVTVDHDPRFACTHTADLAAWEYQGPRPDLIWASPPSVEFSRTLMPWFRNAPAPSMELVGAALRIIRKADPRFWVIENVRGACRWFRPLLGPHRASYGPFFLWGAFPQFRARIRHRKESFSSAQRAERAKGTFALSEALAVAVETCPDLFASVAF